GPAWSAGTVRVMPPESPRRDNTRPARNLAQPGRTATRRGAAPEVGPAPADGVAIHTSPPDGDAASPIPVQAAADNPAGSHARARGPLGRAVVRWRAPWPSRPAWGLWLGTRLLLLALVWAGHALGAQQGVLGDVRLYGGWGTAFVHGHGLPVDDEKWQYPPGAILVFAVPALARVLVGLSYRV